MDPGVAVRPAGFQQQHAVAAGFAEPRRDRAAGRAGAGHDEVEGFGFVAHDRPLDLLRLRFAADDSQTGGDREGHGCFSACRRHSIPGILNSPGNWSSDSWPNNKNELILMDIVLLRNS